MSYSTSTMEFGRITFTAPAADEKYAGYVWVEAQEWKAPEQICYGGDFRGNTVKATTTELKSAAQKWLRQRREWMRKEGF